MRTRLIAMLLALCLLAGMALTALAEEALEIEANGPEAEADIEAVPEIDGELELPEDLDIVPEEFTAPLEETEGLSVEATDAEPTLAEGDQSETPQSSTRVATVTYLGGELYKVYDKTRNFQKSDGTWLLNKKLTTDLFSISGTDPADGEVKITQVTMSKFSSAGVGHYQLNLGFALSNGYTAPGITIPARIDLRPVTITPKPDQSKVYGASDPSWIGLTVKGLLALTDAEKEAGAKLYTGKLSREPGENVGTYKITLGTLDFANSNYSVTLTDEIFTIKFKNINATNVALTAIGSQQYTGKAIDPPVTLTYGSLKLKAGTDFDAVYADNVELGTATVTLTGKGNYTGKRTTTFRIIKDLADSDIVVDDIDDKVYTGKLIKPSVTVKDGEKILKAGTDFKITYKNNKKVGTATVTLTGTGNYSGTTGVSFNINPKGTASFSLKRLKAGFTAKWKKVSGVTGYQVEYGLKKDFSDAKRVSVKGAKKLKKTVKKLKRKKTCYVRIRTYQKVSGKTYYSDWSAAKTVKTK